MYFAHKRVETGPNCSHEIVENCVLHCLQNNHII